MSSFYRDVILKDSRFNSTYRIADRDLLEPLMRQKVEGIVAAAKAKGFHLMVFETYRSQARQELLFEQGSTQLRKVGVHHYGLACDIVRSINGQPSWEGDFYMLGQLAREHSLIWGGDWGAHVQPHTFIDAVHIQRCSIARQASLFEGTWYPDDAYDPYQD
ncbi:M15 family metallopeptidase [Nitrosospira multiformis]|uniref:M15 family metallopeptidase n=1 Tax=Nitrosospira multiformis TaxID=1231 RepID=UPI000896365A|nr:M15 family metallopeptidase [Nitrosospira multiformis]SEA62860.1 D-alanyl-D-alanine carboxypeptidase [Nitrosospira multiformis]